MTVVEGCGPLPFRAGANLVPSVGSVGGTGPLGAAEAGLDRRRAVGPPALGSIRFAGSPIAADFQSTDSNRDPFGRFMEEGSR